MAYMKVDAGEIFLLDEDGETLPMVLHPASGPEALYQQPLQNRGQESLGLAAQPGQHKIVTDLTEENAICGHPIKAGFRQIAYFPWKSAENLMGVMSVATAAANLSRSRALNFR